MLILGLRRANLPRNRALTLEDLEILSLRIVSTLNGNVITEMLHEALSLVGKITTICSDRGSEIIRGVKDFQIISPETRHISDTAYRVANLLESTLEKCSGSDLQFCNLKKIKQNLLKLQNCRSDLGCNKLIIFVENCFHFLPSISVTNHLCFCQISDLLIFSFFNLKI